MKKPETVFCDNCGTKLAPTVCVKMGHTLLCTLRRHYVSDLPVNVDSANAGESAVLCSACYVAVLELDTERVRSLSGSTISY